jgi:hypothetical protein
VWPWDGRLDMIRSGIEILDMVCLLIVIILGVKKKLTEDFHMYAVVNHTEETGDADFSSVLNISTLGVKLNYVNGVIRESKNHLNRHLTILIGLITNLRVQVGNNGETKIQMK